LDLFLAVGVATAVVFVARSALILFQQYVQFRVAETAGARLSTRLLDVGRPRAPQTLWLCGTGAGALRMSD